MTLCERLLNYRAEHGISQKRLAELLGVNSMLIWRAENGAKLHKVNVFKLESKLNELEGNNDRIIK